MNTEVKLLYRELEDRVRANNAEDIRKAYRDLLQVGQSVSEISRIMHTNALKSANSASRSKLEISPNNVSLQHAAPFERAQSLSEIAVAHRTARDYRGRSHSRRLAAPASRRRKTRCRGNFCPRSFFAPLRGGLLDLDDLEFAPD